VFHQEAFANTSEENNYGTFFFVFIYKKRRIVKHLIGVHLGSGLFFRNAI
jgi:hypothetical protein